MYQQLVGAGATARWVTQLELTDDALATRADDASCSTTAAAHEPPATFLPYLGDYIRLLAVGDDFYGVFAGTNRPDVANFPNGVSYQRNANFDHPEAAQDRQRDAGRRLDRPVLLPLHALVAHQWQAVLPESVNAPSDGRKSHSYEVACNVSLRTPWLVESRTSEFGWGAPNP